MHLQKVILYYSASELCMILFYMSGRVLKSANIKAVRVKFLLITNQVHTINI